MDRGRQGLGICGFVAIRDGVDLEKFEGPKLGNKLDLVWVFWIGFESPWNLKWWRRFLVWSGVGLGALEYWQICFFGDQWVWWEGLWFEVGLVG